MSQNRNVGLLLSKAEDSLHAAGELLRSGHHGFSASRSYYAMFYAAQALLLHHNLQFGRGP